MAKVKPKYAELQTKIFLLSEELEQTKARLAKSKIENKEAIEYMVKQIEEVLDGTADNSVGSGDSIVENSVL
jgi:guanylate kinase